MTAPTLNKHLQMVNTEPFWPKRAHMGASWAHKRPYGSVWAHMGPARAHNVRETVLEIKTFGGKRGAVLTFVLSSAQINYLSKELYCPVRKLIILVKNCIVQYTN